MIGEIDSLRLIQINESNWKISTCTCSSWAKKYICPHVIALAQRLHLCEFDYRGFQIPLGQNRNRGRPPMNRPALEMQPPEEQRQSGIPAENRPATETQTTDEQQESGPSGIQAENQLETEMLPTDEQQLTTSGKKSRGRPPKPKKIKNA